MLFKGVMYVLGVVMIWIGFILVFKVGVLVVLVILDMIMVWFGMVFMLFLFFIWCYRKMIF